MDVQDMTELSYINEKLRIDTIHTIDFSNYSLRSSCWTVLVAQSAICKILWTIFAISIPIPDYPEWRTGLELPIMSDCKCLLCSSEFKGYIWILTAVRTIDIWRYVWQKFNFSDILSTWVCLQLCKLEVTFLCIMQCKTAARSLAQTCSLYAINGL